MLNQVLSGLELIVNQTQANLYILAIILSVPWTVFLLSLLDKRVLLLGIMPRHVLGLPGIIFAPLLHANFNHIFFNSIPLAILSNFLLINGLDYYLMVTVILTIGSGLLVWCFGKSGLHIGASGLITGYWGLLVSNTYQQGTITAIILGMISVYYFGGMFLGVFPGKKGISWEGHFFGLITGLGLSYFLSLN